MRRLECAEGGVRRVSGDIASLLQLGQQQQLLRHQQQLAALMQLLTCRLPSADPSAGDASATPPVSPAFPPPVQATNFAASGLAEPRLGSPGVLCLGTVLWGPVGPQLASAPASCSSGWSRWCEDSDWLEEPYHEDWLAENHWRDGQNWSGEEWATEDEWATGEDDWSTEGEWTEDEDPQQLPVPPESTDFPVSPVTLDSPVSPVSPASPALPESPDSPVLPGESVGVLIPAPEVSDLIPAPE